MNTATRLFNTAQITRALRSANLPEHKQKVVHHGKGAKTIQEGWQFEDKTNDHVMLGHSQFTFRPEYTCVRNNGETYITPYYEAQQEWIAEVVEILTNAGLIAEVVTRNYRRGTFNHIYVPVVYGIKISKEGETK
jgi:hypothetical protein